MALLAHRALSDFSLRSLRCSLGCRRLRRIWRNGKALFRHLLLQIVGANIAKSAYFVVARRGKTPPLAPPQHGGARFPTLAAQFWRCAVVSTAAQVATSGVFLCGFPFKSLFGLAR
jgi:hypothetical protein